MKTLGTLPCAVSAAAAQGTCPTAAPMQSGCGPATCAGNLGTAVGSAPTVSSAPSAFPAVLPSNALLPFRAGQHFSLHLLQRAGLLMCHTVAWLLFLYHAAVQWRTDTSLSFMPLQCSASSAISQDILPATARAGRPLLSSWPQSACDAGARTAQLPKQEILSGAA